MLLSTISAYALTHLAIIHKLKTFVNYISTKWHTFPRQILSMCHRKDLGQTLRHPSPLPDPRLKGTLQIITTQAARHFFFFFFLSLILLHISNDCTTATAHTFLFGFTSFVLTRSSIVFNMSPSEFRPKDFYLNIHKKTKQKTVRNNYTALSFQSSNECFSMNWLSEDSFTVINSHHNVLV